RARAVARRACSSAIRRLTDVMRCMTMVCMTEPRDYQLTIRIPRRVYDELESEANRDHRSIADVVNIMLEQRYPSGRATVKPAPSARPAHNVGGERVKPGPKKPIAIGDERVRVTPKKGK